MLLELGGFTILIVLLLPEIDTGVALASGWLLPLYEIVALPTALALNVNFIIFERPLIVFCPNPPNLFPLNSTVNGASEEVLISANLSVE